MSIIAGELTSTGETADRETVERMIAAMPIANSGSQQLWQECWAALGHQRSENGCSDEQPEQLLQDSSSGLAIAFSGSLYNSRELFDTLRRDFNLASLGDAELVLTAYTRWGESFVTHLDGAFAFVIFDGHRDRAVIARDRLGVKPMYYAHVAGKLRFASTMPGILAGGGVDTQLDTAGLHHYLTWHSIVPAPTTIFRGVRKLPPATIMIVEANGDMREHQYWYPEYRRDADRAGWSKTDWTDAVHDGLVDAVKRRQTDTAPTSVLLSGGLDSSMLVGIAAEMSSQPVETFSIGFDGVGENAGDEYRYSDRVAEYFATKHQQIHIGAAELGQAIPGAVSAMTEPMASHDVTAFYLLSQKTAEQTAVVQSGQGADEVFGGYAYHRSAADVSRADAAQHFQAAFHDRDHDEVNAILTPEFHSGSDVSRAFMESHLEASGAETACDAIMRFDTHSLMVDDPVKRVDSMTVPAGLEARVPFLDTDLVELAAACPPELKTQQDGKGILKDIGRRFLPHEVVDRTKGYFPVPGLRELRGEVLDSVRDVMTSDAARQRHMFHPEVVDNLLADPNGTADQRGGNVLWSIAVLEMWLQEHAVGAK